MKTNIFKKETKEIVWLSVFTKLINIPYILLVSYTLSELTALSMDGDIANVLRCGIFFIGAIAIYSVLNIGLQIKYQKEVFPRKQKCKRKLYEMFLNRKLSDLNQSSPGNIIENFSDDFEIYMSAIIEMKPLLWVSVIIMMLLSIFLFRIDVLLVIIILLLAVLQLIPPIVARKYMQVNYDNCREMEEKITNFILTAFSGFVTIRIYDMKKWWMEKLKNLQKEYQHIGNISIFTTELEEMMYDLLQKLLEYGTYCIIGVMILFSRISLKEGISAIVLAKYVYVYLKNVERAISQLAEGRKAEERLNGNCFGGRTEENTNRFEVDISDLSYSYGKRIFDHIDWKTGDNRKYMITGENGNGKTTLLKLMVGILEPQYGQIRVGGVRPENLSRSNFPEKIFYMEQDDPDFNMPAGELIESFGGKENSASIWGRMNAFGIMEKELNRPFNQLSGGEKKKIFLSLALSHTHELLLMDEPTNHLDLYGKKVLLQLLKEYQGTVIIISHDPLMEETVDEIWMLRNGELQKNEKR